MSNFSNQDKKRFAEWFIEQGFAIFPIDPQSKKPVISNWQKYSHEPLTDEEKKRFLEQIEKGYNYAVPGGQQNLVILDFESKELLEKWISKSALDELCRKTLCVNTPHGGIHVYVQADNIPEHKFNPAFTLNGKGIADLQSYNSYVLGVGSCINHKFCDSDKCKWRGQNHTTCYSLYNNNELKIGRADLKGLLKFLAEKGKELGIELSSNARAWLEGEKEETDVEKDLEKLKKELSRFNKFKGKTIEAIRSEVCQSIKKSLENVKSDKAKTMLNTAFQVVCQGKSYGEIQLDRSRGDWHVLKVLLSHGVTDVEVLKQLLPQDSKVFAPKWDRYFLHTLMKAWNEVKPFLQIIKNAKNKKTKELKQELAEVLSQYIIRKYHIVTFIQKHSNGESIIGIFRWNRKKGIYEPIDETLKKIIRHEIMRVIETFPKSEDEKSPMFYEVRNELVKLVYDEIRDLTLTEYDDDNTPLRIAFENCTLEWTSDKFKLIPADKRTEEHYAFHYVPHKIRVEVFNNTPYQVPELEELARKLCPKSLNAFKQWVGEKWVTLFEIIGYTLYPATKFKLAFMLLGPRDSGKSTFLQLLKRILGKQNTVSIRLRELFDPNNRFVAGFLFHKLVNLTAETKEYTIEDIDRFKTLTGGDQITSDVKFKGPITFTPYAKLIIASNKLPDIRDKNDTAFWRRWLIIEFPNQFPNDDNWFRQTFTEEEIEGILTVSILAFARVMSRGQFDYQQTPEEVRDLWLYNIDSVWSFVRTYEKKGFITVDPRNADLWVPRIELYKLYKDYCMDNGFPGVSLKTFANKLNKYFGITSMKKYFGKDPNGKEIRRRCFVGITINYGALELEKLGKPQDITPSVPQEIRRFEECLGFSVGNIAYQLSTRTVVREEELLKLFKDQHGVVKKVEECLRELNFVDNGDGTFRKPTPEELYKDYKCTTIWYTSQYNELKGKTVKVKDLDPDFLMCLKKFGQMEQVDDETIRIK
ncbi:phage/plasmid primase, P4 family [Saccharolobus islandicus]|uniref:Helicase-like protein n=1 Tax=Saccharolobus islandicus TaxID=43080 RepID=O05477_SACIS|nr:phage/plasmid primase, P4 family [Sulfolobus islandicus]AAB51531.1 helicase-like protein [Sulfolobus islandicus]